MPRLRSLSFLLLLAPALAGDVAVSPSATPVRQMQSLDADWRFHRGDFPLPANVGTPLGAWQWKPASEESLRALCGLKEGGDVQKGVPRDAALPPEIEGGTWTPAAVDQDVFQAKAGYAWFRTTLPASEGTPSYVYFQDAPNAHLIYFNGKLITPRIYDHNVASFTIPLEGWKKDGANVLIAVMKGPGHGIGHALLVSPGQAGGVAAPVAADGPAAARYDDTAWTPVTVPHDYVVEGPFDAKALHGHASLPVDPAWYRRTLPVPESARGKRLWLEFDGVFCNALLWINGRFIDLHYSGYNSFRYDITDFVDYGKDNTISIRVDPRQFMGWWYEGGGIYRHVRLVTVNPLHVAPWGVQVTSSVPDPGNGKQADAQVQVVTTLENAGKQKLPLTVTAEIVDPHGVVVGKAETEGEVPAQGSGDVPQKITLPSANLWSPDHPSLYTLRTVIHSGGTVCDQVQTTFGVRKIVWDADRGLLLNGQPLKVKGTCNHGDFIGVGTAMPARVQEWRIEKLKEMGSNAYRCSHNPPAPEILDACDRLGMLVLDENRFLGDSPEILSEVENMIRRDRNHPSVFLWSLCNEEPAQGNPLGAIQGKAMIDLAHRLDDRLVTAAMNHGWGGGLSEIVDVQGFNYHPDNYDKFHQQFPRLPTIATESASTMSSRGVYEDDPARGYVSAYNTKKVTADEAWQPVATRPFVAGAFVWTGFEYKGEPSPYGWPCVNSNYGVMDNCGFPKDDYYYYKAWWDDTPMVHVGGHWNWAGKEGQEIPVQVYSNCDQVELLLNGRSLGTQKVPPFGSLKWTVPYESGVLQARATRGNEVFVHRIETTGAPAAIQAIPDARSVASGGSDLAIVEVRVVDDQGRIVPTADNPLAFSVEGSGAIVGVGNGDPSSHEPDKAQARLAFNGLAMVLVQHGHGPQGGKIRLDVASPGLKSARIEFNSPATPVPPNTATAANL